MATYISVDRVIPNPNQPRQVFDEEQLKGLSKTIKKHGVLQPIVVYQDGECFVLIDGERRWRAAQMAGKKRIRADIRRKPAGKREGAVDVSRLEKALIANIQRQDMNPVEEGDAYLALIEHGLTQNEIAGRLGIYPVRVSNCLVFARASNEIRDLVSAGKLYKSVDLIRVLMNIPDPVTRVRMAQELASRKIGLDASIKAANIAVRACTTSEKLSKCASPAMAFASSRSRVNGKPPQWDALKQIGKVPEWDVIASAAERTCQKCSLADIASEDNCGQCPAVDQLVFMMEDAK